MDYGIMDENYSLVLDDLWDEKNDSSGCECQEEDALKEADFFSHRYRLVGTLFQGIIFIVGVLGNAMVVIVVTKVRALHSPTNCYLVSLAIADTVVLVASVPNEILSYYLVGNQWVWGEAGCKLLIFGQNLGINASSLSLIAFTTERYIAICHPMKAHKMCTLGRAKKITRIVWMFAILYCSPWFGLIATRPLRYRGYPTISECVFTRPRNEYLAYFFADLLMFYVIPLLLSCVLYALITRTLLKRESARSPGQLTAAISMECNKIASSKSQVSVFNILMYITRFLNVNP